MQINITIIPEGKQAAAHQFDSLEEAWMYLAKMLPVPPTASTSENAVSSVVELSPVTPKKFAFIKRIFGI